VRPQTLPAEKQALEDTVRDLERGLAASQAEAKALRDQVSFLQRLVAGNAGGGLGGGLGAVGLQFLGWGGGGAVNAAGAAGAAAGASGPTAGAGSVAPAGVSAVGTSPAGVMLLAVACLVTFNQAGLATSLDFFDLSAAATAAAAATSPRGHGGRVLLSAGGDEGGVGRVALRWDLGLMPAAAAAVEGVGWRLAAMVVILVVTVALVSAKKGHPPVLTRAAAVVSGFVRVFLRSS
jgi:hypothetical protein